MYTIYLDSLLMLLPTPNSYDNCHAMFRRQHFTELLPVLNSFCPLFSVFSEPWAVVPDVQLRTEHSTVTYSLHFGYL